MLTWANADFQDNAPLSAADAATVILAGVRPGTWRILVGEDGKTLDALVRAKPEAALTTPSWLSGTGRSPPATPAPKR